MLSLLRAQVQFLVRELKSHKPHGIATHTQMNKSIKQKQTHRHREQTCGCQERDEVGEGRGAWGQQM